MEIPARKKIGAVSLPGLVFLVGGLLLLIAAWLFFPERELPASDPTQATPGASTPLEPGQLSDPSSIRIQEPTWQPEGVLPPDSPYRSGVRPTEALVRGRITLRARESWPSRVEVWLERAADGTEVARAHPTRESPSFRFEKLPFGSYRLRLEADTMLPITMQLSASERSPDLFQDLPLQPASGVNGRVLSRSGEPAAGVPVTAEPIPADARTLVTPRTTWSQADGSFLLQGLDAGEYWIYPGPARTPVGERSAVRVGSDGALAWVAIELPALGAARVLVEEVAVADRAEVQVRAQRIRLGAGQLPYEETRALGEDGSVRFLTLPPGDYAFTAWSARHPQTLREARVSLEIEPEVRIPLRPDARGLPPR